MSQEVTPHYKKVRATYDTNGPGGGVRWQIHLETEPNAEGTVQSILYAEGTSWSLKAAKKRVFREASSIGATKRNGPKH